MDIILKEIVAIIKEETENINKKIYGTTFLEILKEKIINRQDQINLKNLQIKNSNVLDLFAGIGSFGLECISRGARSVTFVENNSKTSEVLVKNLKQLQVLDKSTLYNLDVCEFLKNKK